jgi:hypothetical protein
MSEQPKRQFGGKQEGAGRKAKSPSDSLHQVNVYVDWDTFQFLKDLPAAERKQLKREAAAVLKGAEINSRIL